MEITSSEKVLSISFSNKTLPFKIGSNCELAIVHKCLAKFALPVASRGFSFSVSLTDFLRLGVSAQGYEEDVRLGAVLVV